jgi:cytochrome c-type biogenesis protein CcsB
MWRTTWAVVAFGVLLLTATIDSARADDHFADPRYIPVQDGGRLKPFDTYARSLLRDLSGKERWNGHDATSVAMSIAADGDTWKQEPFLKVEYLELKDKYDLKRDQKYFSFDELLSRGQLINDAEALRNSGRKDFDDFEKAILETYNKLVTLDMAARGQTPAVVPFMSMSANQAATAPGAPRPWFSIKELENAPVFAKHRTQWAEVESAALSGDDSRTQAAIAGWVDLVQDNEGFSNVDPRRIDLEVAYNSLNPFRKAWILYVVAFVLFLAGWSMGNRTIGFVANFVLWGGFVFHTGGLLARQYLAGRPPISNLYEALTFIIWGVVMFSILFEMRYRRRVHGTVAAVLGSIGLVLAEIMPIDRELNPLVAVLRSYWMQYHVTTILLSYSALTLAAGIAHFHLAVEWFAPHKKDLARKASDMLYTAMKIGVTTLATGIILGAWWASESWGRYWGWDPKETWSLITLLGYIAVLHGRFAGWLTRYGMSVANVACWGLVLFTFYGVNFFLVGLHSYAGEAAAVKLPPLLIVYLVFELIVVGVGIWYTKSGRLRTRQAAAS